MITRFFSRIIFFYFKDIWNLKKKLNEMKYSYTKHILLSVYNKKIDKKGSYIGSRSIFVNRPIFPHGINGIFISDASFIGSNCIIFQQVTIGSNNLRGSKSFGSPVIGNNVVIGAGAKIIGRVKIGDNCRIGANCIVHENMSANSVAVMQPARIIKKDNEITNQLYTQRDTKEGLLWGFYNKEGKWILDEDFKSL